MNEDNKVYTKSPIHECSRGLCSKCTKILWVNGCKQYTRKFEHEDGYRITVECEGFELIKSTEED